MEKPPSSGVATLAKAENRTQSRLSVTRRPRRWCRHPVAAYEPPNLRLSTLETGTPRSTSATMPEPDASGERQSPPVAQEATDEERFDFFTECNQLVNLRSC